MPKYVYAFAEGNKDLKALLGGKGANLAEMTNTGLPFPPGFVVTTEACQAFLRDGVTPPELAGQVDEHLEKAAGDDPALGSAAARVPAPT